MSAGSAPMLQAMAEQVQLVEAGTEGAVECKAPGCANWFVKNSGRHVYCKAETCTYRRGAPPAAELVSPQGALEELMRRMQEADEESPGPALLMERMRALAEAMKEQDTDAVFGACIDVGTCVTAMADRARGGHLPVGERLPVRRGPQSTSQRPVGLAAAAVSSHQRTYELGNERVKLIWDLMEEREKLASTELALEQTQGSPAEEEARAANKVVGEQLQALERSLTSVEAAWAERGTMLRELQAAAANGNGERQQLTT